MTTQSHSAFGKEPLGNAEGGKRILLLLGENFEELEFAAFTPPI